MSRLRPVALALAVTAALLAPVLTAAPAQAAKPRVYAELADPLMTDPLQVQVDVVDATGTATAFFGTMTLAVGRTKTSTPVSADASGLATATLRTARLPAGAATLTVKVRTASSGSATLVLRQFVVLDPPYALAGFGCNAVGSASSLRWAVTSLHGLPIRTPIGRGGVLLPYVPSVARLSLISGDDGLPIATRGTVTITNAAGRRVGRIALRSQVRGLQFAVPVPAGLRSRLRSGTDVATLVLTDAGGRSATARQTVVKTCV